LLLQRDALAHGAARPAVLALLLKGRTEAGGRSGTPETAHGLVGRRDVVGKVVVDPDDAGIDPRHARRRQGQLTRSRTFPTTSTQAYHRAAGDVALAQDHAAQGLTHASEPRQPLALLAAHRLLGELATEAGRHAEAQDHLDEALALAEACAAPYERALTVLALADLRAASGDRPAALALLDEVRAICEPLGARPALARAEALAAQVAIAP
jgi:tetratricopeptide (TPR) repeat protein